MKLFRSFVALLISEFPWIIISDFALSRFQRRRSLQTEEKWEESRKDGMILQNQRNSSDRRKSGIMLGLVLGDWKERQGQVYFTSWVAVCKGFSRSINIYFQPKLCGFGDTGHATKWDTLLFFQFRNETKSQDFHTWNREIGILLTLYWKIGISWLNRDEWQVWVFQPKQTTIITSFLDHNLINFWLVCNIDSHTWIGRDAMTTTEI